MTTSLALAYLLAWRWQSKRQLLDVEFTVPLHWTDRDRQAWQLVESRAKSAAKFPLEKLGSLPLYVDSAQGLALDLARFYHPGIKDPIGSLTIPEILAVVELASHDLAEMVDRYVPASNLLTIDHWKGAKKASEWYQSANQAYWLISAIFSPLTTGLRLLASEIGITMPLQKLQQNLILWFYTAYLHRLGTYLIDVNSGRLRVGAKRYRELVEQQTAGDSSPATPQADAAEAVQRITITFIGQVSVGKSSLINALLGEQRARCDALPATSAIARYELRQEGIATRLILLDTVGYGQDGASPVNLRATEEAARQSDLIFLVLHARNPARQADLNVLQSLKRWFATQPDLNLPPILGIMNHIDLLSPAMEWSPPYDWRRPQRPKEKNIEQAMVSVREQLGEHIVGVVPVCTVPGKIYGVNEWLMLAITGLLDEAKAVAFLRCLRVEADTGKARKVFQQFLQAGQGAAGVLWQVIRQK